MPNATIVDAIRARLEDDPHISQPIAIAVAERNGTVTLKGTITGFRQRHAAVEIAKTTAGVHSVEDELKVDPRYRYTDDSIRGVALQALMNDDAVPADRVDVHVSNGWLTLQGSVDRQRQSDGAFADVSAVPGVGGITNEIKVITA